MRPRLCASACAPPLTLYYCSEFPNYNLLYGYILLFKQVYECEDEDEDDGALDVEDLKWKSLNKDALMLNTSSSTSIPLPPGAILESTTNPEDWQLEVERVMPQLKVTLRTDCKVIINIG